MSNVCWIINRRKCLEFVGLLTGVNVQCLSDYKQPQMSSVSRLINSRKCLVSVGLLTVANVEFLLAY